MEGLIIDTPESVELQTFFIVVASWDHFKVRLVSNYMVNDMEGGCGSSEAEQIAAHGNGKWNSACIS